LVFGTSNAYATGINNTALIINQAGNATFQADLSADGSVTLGDGFSSDTVISNATAWTFAADTNFTLSGGANGLSFDTDTLSIDATGNAVGIGTTAPGAYKLAVAGNTSITGGLDITSTGAPVQSGYLTDGTNLDEILEVKVVGNYAYYVGTGATDYFGIIDITDKESPFLISSLSHADLSSPAHLHINGKYAYIPDYGNSKISVLDISNPKQPFLVKTITDSTILQCVRNVYFSGQYLYTASSCDGDSLSIIDVSDPYNPALVGYVRDARLDSIKVSYVEGKYAYAVSVYSRNLVIIDISNPTNPFVAGSVQHDSLQDAQKVAKRGSYLYSIGGINGIGVFNVSNPQAPTYVTQVASSCNWDVKVAGERLYCSQYSAQYFATYDISTPSAPALLSTYTGGNSLEHFDVSGSYAYVASRGDDTLRVLYLGGLRSTLASVGSLDADSTNITGTLSVLGLSTFAQGISVGAPGIMSDGPIAVETERVFSNPALKLTIRDTLASGDIFQVSAAPDKSDYVYYYNGSTYTDNTTEANSSAGTAFTLLGDSTTYGYFGNSATFSSINFDLNTAGKSLTEVLNYPGTSGNYNISTETTEANTPLGTAFTLLADTNDYLYFGLDAQFTEVFVDVATAGTGMTTAWEYCSAKDASNYCTTWSALTVSGDETGSNNNGTNSFESDGKIAWSAPGNWTTSRNNWGTYDTHNLVKYWVRVNASAVTVAPTAYYASAQLPVTLQYYNGSAWAAVSAIYDDTQGLSRDGRISFAIPSSWSATSVNSQSAYWIRLALAFDNNTAAMTPGTSPTAYMATVAGATGNFANFLNGGTSMFAVNNLGTGYFAGNLGLGTTSPVTKLDVMGGIRLGANGGANDILNTSSGSAPSGALYWGNRTICDSSGNCSGTGAGIGGSGTQYYIPRFAGTYNIENSQLYDTGTYVGVGTTAPSNLLSVAGNVDITGNLGIGTTSPQQKLSVAGAFGFLEGGTSPQYYTIFQGGDQGGNITYTWPTAGAASDDYVLTSTSGGVLEWKQVTSVGAAGDITAVGNITSGAAFTSGTPGSSLFFADGGYLGIGSTDARMQFVDSTTDQINFLSANVGIGTTSPTATFQVDGTAWLRGSDSTDGIFVESNGTVGINTKVPGTNALKVAGDTQITGDTVLDGQLAISGASINNNYFFNIGTVGNGQRGINNTLQLTAGGQIGYGYYGNLDVASTTSSSVIGYSIFNSLTGANSHAGPFGSSVSWLYGVYNLSGTITETDPSFGTVRVVGMHNNFGGKTAGSYYGVYNDFDSHNVSSRYAYGMYNNFSAVTGDASTYIGDYNLLQAAGDSAAQTLIGSDMVLDTRDATDTTYGLRINQNGTSSTAGTQYGVYLNLTDTDVTRWGIYEAGGATNYLAGNLGIGTTNPGGALEVVGNVLIGGSNNELRFYEGSNYIGFEAPALSADQIWILPDSDGSVNQVLATDSAGNLNWIDVSAGAGGIGGGGTTNYLSKWTNSTTLTNSLLYDTGSAIGIGTTGPDRLLDLLDASNPQLRLTQADGTVYADFQMASTGDLVIGVDGVTSQLVLDNGGNVGIGTTGPGYKLEVNGAIRANTVGEYGLLVGNIEASSIGASVVANRAVLGVFSSSESPLFKIGQSNTAFTSLFHEYNATEANSGMRLNTYAPSSGYQQFAINSTNIMRLTSGGSVGIGTTNPSQKLEVVGKVLTSGSASAIEVAPRDGSGTTFGFYNYTGDDLQIGSGLVTIIGTGNVGIGTTGPLANLHIHSGANPAKFKFTNDTTGAGASDGFEIGNSVVDSNVYFWQYENSYLRFATNNTERFRISAAGGFSFGSYVATDPGVGNMIISGNVGIGTTAPSYLLSVGSTSQFGVNSSGIALLPDGAVGTPALSFSGDADTGLYRIAEDKISLITG
ncbi:MAG: hypothetical protein UW65_C0027G0001, partial [candidate division WWE3 bacterium GW2011_GWB1_44_4]